MVTTVIVSEYLDHTKAASVEGGHGHILWDAFVSSFTAKSKWGKCTLLSPSDEFLYVNHYEQYIIEGHGARASLGLPLMHSFVHVNHSLIGIVMNVLALEL
jgi:hypothetical protein